jgi:poly(3-hydroxybutyrate) depolymerase
MAVQFEVAHSSIVVGAGVIAGGPYYCAQGDAARATTRCSCTFDPAHALCDVSATSADVAALGRATRRFFADGAIDDPANVARHRVYVLAGGVDAVVPAPVVQQLADYYAELSASAIDVVVKPGLAHTMPTVRYGKACDVADTPYIGRCGFSAAHDILEWIYGPLNAPSERLGGQFVRFDQARYVASPMFWLTGMDTTGWLYVPRACARGARCRLHVALHGCRQGQDYAPLTGARLHYGTTFVRHAGYAQAADANRIVVLFPQAVSIPFLNPDGCWDWWGYTDANYATRRGVQVAAIRAMIDRVASGAR